MTREEAIARYVERNPKSAQRARRAAEALPGGNTRTVLHFDPFPLAFTKGEGPYLWSLDGDRYVDMLGEFTAGLYGHSNPTIIQAIKDALDRGISFGGVNELEVQLAHLLTARFPAMELVRFTNSGTEANLMALALAVHHTGKQEILVFKGAYHGGVLAFGSGEPSPVTVPHRFVLGDYNDLEGTKTLIRNHDLAAILIEPMLGSGGCIPATPAFLQMLRDEANDALLIFDEVMTSRLPRPAVTPDLMTVGKYLAGGMSFGAFGGRQDLMAAYDPTRPGALQHAGTFNNNVVSMSAGIAGLTHVLTDDRLAALNARGDRLRDTLNEIAAEEPITVTGRGSLMTIHTDDRERLFFELLDRGFWVASRLMLALNLEITDEHCDAFAEAFEASVC